MTDKRATDGFVAGENRNKNQGETNNIGHTVVKETREGRLTRSENAERVFCRRRQNDGRIAETSKRHYRSSSSFGFCFSL